jgi:UDP-2,3-diacylglucosamine hydrolase
LSHSLFISDLHLPAAPSPLRETFARFLAGPARAAGAVYILGDLFEVWIGDDAGLEAYAAERAGLQALTAAGVRAYFQHGNRDFLVGRRFAAATGVQILPDPHPLDLHGLPTLLSHGDLFCTDDVRYQRWRRFARNPATQAIFNVLPLAARARIAGGVRAGTTADMRNKADDIMDASEAAVAAAFREHNVARIIHGHTHRPADHRYDIDGRECWRHVLADWRSGRCEALRVDAASVNRILL